MKHLVQALRQRLTPSSRKPQLALPPTWQLLAVSISAWSAYFAWFWSHAGKIKDGALYVGHVNMWGDWAAHFTIGTAFMAKGWVTTSPFLWRAKFSYPFVSDMISGLLMRVGNMELLPAFIWPSFLFCVAMVLVLHWFYASMLRSTKAAVLAVAIFFFNGGLGFWYFIQDILNATDPWQTLLNPPHEYTRLDAVHIKWISVIDSMIIPQRAFTLGFPVALLALTLIWRGLVRKKSGELLSQGHEKSPRTWWQRLPIHDELLFAGILLGTLPIVHTHSFLASFIILASWACVDLFRQGRSWQDVWPRMWAWGTVAVGTLLIALPLMLRYYSGHVGSSFFQWYPGWLARENKESWLLFWWRNWGFTPAGVLLGVVGLTPWAKRLGNKQLSIWFFVPFGLLWVMINLFLFQPFTWDNTKLLVWAWAGLAPLVAVGLLELAHTIAHVGRPKVTGLGKQLRTWAGRSIAILLGSLIIAAGAIDAYWVARTDLHTYMMYNESELRAKDWVLTHTSSDSIWLTSDQHNHWLFNLTGRQTVMAYRGWLWTHGYNYQDIERDVRDMYLGSARATRLLKEYQVDYVVISLSEKRDFNANVTFFAKTYPLSYINGEIAIYRTSSLPGASR